jgi:hypothetical protein
VNQKTKKTIAKEVLLAFSIVVILLLAILGIMIYNSIQGTNAVKIRDKAYAIDNQIDSVKSEIKKLDGLPPLELLESQKIHSDKKKSLMDEHYDYHYSKLNYGESKQFLSMIACILLIILYPIRGLYLLIIWAIRTLKG